MKSALLDANQLSRNIGATFIILPGYVSQAVLIGLSAISVGGGPV
jgi:hypothetical protein